MTPRVIATPISGVVLLEAAPIHDGRGSFARLSCIATLAAHGIAFTVRQTSLSRSHRRGTLRGLHFQIPPSAETKLIHCLAGAVFDVALDLRPDSPTFRHAFSTELSAANGRGMLIPSGCAHGALTLTDNVMMLYEIDCDHDLDRARGVRWNDPAFNIDWPFPPVVIADRDSAWPDFAP
jgi:dTDP-4-dehydrorhamnose 3,5-epimerase